MDLDINRFGCANEHCTLMFIIKLKSWGLRMQFSDRVHFLLIRFSENLIKVSLIRLVSVSFNWSIILSVSVHGRHYNGLCKVFNGQYVILICMHDTDLFTYSEVTCMWTITILNGFCRTMPKDIINIEVLPFTCVIQSISEHEHEHRTKHSSNSLKIESTFTST